jgi:hypothetical protein
MSNLTRRGFLFSLLVAAAGVVGAQVLDPFAVAPAKKREALSRRLDGYVQAYRVRDWRSLYSFVSIVGLGGAGVDQFEAAMEEGHGEDFANYPDLKSIRAQRAFENGDGYDVYGWARAVREGETHEGVAVVHTVLEHDDWFFSGWTFVDLSSEKLSDPSWQPTEAFRWNKPLAEIKYAH